MMRSVELFTGCGGLAMGLSRAGFRHMAMAEWDDHAVSTIEYNRGRRLKHVRDWPIQKIDVREMDWSRFAGEVDLCAGGPPCQPFSIGGKHHGYNDPRDMWPEAVRAVREMRPRAFLFENVRGLARPAFAEYLGWILEYLRRPDLIRHRNDTVADHVRRLRRSRLPVLYEVVVSKVNAADFGAPQKRHRVIVAGIRTDHGVPLTSLRRTHSRERLLWEQWVSGDYWRRHAVNQPGDQLIASVDAALVRRLRASLVPPPEKPWVTVRDVIRGLGEPNGERNHVLQDGARVYPGHTGSPLDQPAKALKAGDHGVPGGENMLVRENGTVRYFTIREAARLQGLPDTYQFPGPWGESMRQLGNAVPADLAGALGQWIYGLLAEAGDATRRAA